MALRNIAGHNFRLVIGQPPGESHNFRLVQPEVATSSWDVPWPAKHCRSQLPPGDLGAARRKSQLPAGRRRLLNPCQETNVRRPYAEDAFAPRRVVHGRSREVAKGLRLTSGTSTEHVTVQSLCMLPGRLLVPRSNVGAEMNRTIICKLSTCSGHIGYTNYTLFLKGLEQDLVSARIVLKWS